MKDDLYLYRLLHIQVKKYGGASAVQVAIL